MPADLLLSFWRVLHLWYVVFVILTGVTSALVVSVILTGVISALRCNCNFWHVLHPRYVVIVVTVSVTSAVHCYCHFVRMFLTS